MVPSAGHLFYVADLDAPALDGSDLHHAARVLRLRDGEELSVSDGAGRWRRARWTAGAVEPDGDVVVEAVPRYEVCVAFALVKGAKPELVVQKLTELGVDRIVPFTAARSVVRWDPARADRAHERLVATAREAGMQSRRSRLPEVVPTTSFAEVVGGGVAAPVLADRGGRPISADDRAVLVGPEGGWDPDELAAVPEVVSLADGVLRAETAAIVAGMTLTGFRSGRFQHAG